MLSFEQVGALLDAAMEELPEGIFDGLNGGVNLLQEARRSDDGRYLLGLYHNDSMGRYIEIFYGSFPIVFPDAADEVLAEELKKTLRHELTHHVESRAGDRTLERWDEEQAARWQEELAQMEPLEADSILFASDDGLLASAAAALFCTNAPDIPCAAVCLNGAPSEIPEALQSAARCMNLRMERPLPADRTLLKRYDVTLCMALEQADVLAARYPKFDARILCLGETDILPPEEANGWMPVLRRLRRETWLLASELRGEETET